MHIELSSLASHNFVIVTFETYNFCENETNTQIKKPIEIVHSHTTCELPYFLGNFDTNYIILKNDINFKNF
jgi:hypothetical protein